MVLFPDKPNLSHIILYFVLIKTFLTHAQTNPTLREISYNALGGYWQTELTWLSSVRRPRDQLGPGPDFALQVL